MTHLDSTSIDGAWAVVSEELAQGPYWSQTNCIRFPTFLIPYNNTLHESYGNKKNFSKANEAKILFWADL